MKAKIYLSSSFLLVALWAFAQVKMEKDYNESFEATKGNKVEISNKYGEVIIQTWKDARVQVRGKVIAQGRKREVVNKNMGRVNVEMRKVGQIITVHTDIESRGGTFTELFKDVEDYSKALFGSQKLVINLEIWIPEDIDLSVQNKYGDVYLADLTGDVDITLAHGDLRANRLAGHAEIEHSFGKANFDYIERGRFTLRGVETTIDAGSSFSFQSSSSELNLAHVHFVRLDSRNDKIKAIDVNEIVGNGRFTNLSAELVNRSVDLDFSFGEITLDRIEPRFKNIQLSTRSTDINLTLNQASYVKANIKGDENKMIVPNSMLSLSRDYNEETGFVTLSGMLGPTQDFQSNLSIDSQGGDLVISIKDIPVVTDRR